MTDTRKLNGKPAEGRPRQTRLAGRAIGERLRQMYDGVVQESVPDEFLQLLEQAEAKAKGDAGKRGGGDA